MLEKRNAAFELLHSYIKNPKMIYHSIASEAVLKNIAMHLNQDEDEWGICGLLHDIDVEITNAEPKIHGTKAKEILLPLNLPENIIEAIELHNEISASKPRSKPLHHALAAGETLTGLIFATAYVYPDKMIHSVKPKSIIKRMKEKHFAASVKRENIMECELLGIEIKDFIELSLQALVPIQHTIGFIS